VDKQIKFEFVPIDDLHVDTKNPRVALWVEMYKEVTEVEMRLAVQRGGPEDDSTGTSYNALKQSIRTNGGVIHPIVVNRETDGTLRVIEGNTRTLIYKEFKTSKVTGNWDTIPAIEHDSLTEQQIDAIRLQSHLVGPREWDPYSKAKYLSALRDMDMPFSLVVDYCGGNQREVERLIDAYSDMEKYYRPIVEADDKYFDYTRFSGFVELQNPRIVQALVAFHFSKTDFAKWIDDKRLHPLNTVRHLPRILQNELSRKVFLEDGAEEAIKVLDKTDQHLTVTLENASLLQLAKALHKKIISIPWGEIQNLRTDPDTEMKDVMGDVKDVLQDFCRDITPEEK
jgi:hypothetical protein